MFSVLPDHLVEAATDEALKRLKSEQHEASPTLKWADFTRSGRFLRGGSTTLSDYLTRFVSEASSDPVIETNAVEKPKAPSPEQLETLTRRERQVLYWVVEGRSNSEIGKILEISTRTVEKHCESIFKKLRIESRYTAIVFALTEKWELQG